MRKSSLILASLAESFGIALESTGHWYWLVGEIEKGRPSSPPHQPFTAKRMMGHTHKTDPLDAKGLAIRLRTGTLPEVWIPPRDLRDLREILRTMLKHRIHSALERYGIFHTGIPGTVHTFSLRPSRAGTEDFSTA